MLSQKIYEEFLKHCRPYPASGLWRDLVIDAECFACPTFGTAALAHLAEDFFESELIAAGIARRAEDDGLIINSALVGEDDGVIALRVAANAPPFALLTSAGTFSREASQSFSVLQDGRTQALLKDVGSLLIVAFGVEDVIVLRSLELPAVTNDELSELTTEKLAQIKAMFGWSEDVQSVNAALPSFDNDKSMPQVTEEAQEVEVNADPRGHEDSEESACRNEPQPALEEHPLAADRTGAETMALPESEGQRSPPTNSDDLRASEESLLPADSAAPILGDGTPSRMPINNEPPGHQPAEAMPSLIKPQPLTLILAGWSLARMSLERPHKLPALADWLLQAARCLRFDVSRIAVWLPSADDVRRIQFALDAQSMKDVARLFLESMDSSLFTLNAIHRMGEDSRESHGFLKALREYEESGRHRSVGGAANDRDESKQAIFDAIDRNVVQRLIDDAEARDGGLDQVLCTVAAMSARSLLQIEVTKTPMKFGTAASETEWRRIKEQASIVSKETARFLAAYREIRR